MDGRDTEKKDRLLAALDKGMVMVHLDARRPGVQVPPALRGEANLRLNLSYRFDPPDLTVTEWGLRQTLSFSGVRHGVAVPWSALFAIRSRGDGEFWLYPDDLPDELLQSASEAEASGEPAATPPARPQLREIQGERADQPAEAGAASEGASGGPDDGPPAPRPSHLRLVK